MDVTMVICLLVLGGVVGFAAGLLGIGGGMLLVPFLTMLFTWQKMPADLVVHAAIATSMTSILFTSISSVRAHQQRGTIKWRIVAAMAPGIIVGGLLSGGVASKVNSRSSPGFSTGTANSTGATFQSASARSATLPAFESAIPGLATWTLTLTGWPGTSSAVFGSAAAVNGGCSTAMPSSGCGEVKQ